MPKKSKKSDDLHFHVWLGSAYSPATTEQWAAEWVRAAATITGIPGTLFRILGCRAKWIPPACVDAAQLDAMVDYGLAEDLNEFGVEETAEMKADLDAMLAFRLAQAQDEMTEDTEGDEVDPENWTGS